MKSNTTTIRSVLVTLDIQEVLHDSLRDSSFSPEEQAELGSRHIRSTAGRLALKRAVRQLMAGGKTPALAERDIILGRGPNGRPVLLSLGNGPAGSAPDNLFVSISHTKNTAYGLAVLQED